MYHNTVCTRPDGTVVRISCPTPPQVDEFAHPVAIFDYTKIVVIPTEVGYIRAACSKGGVVLVAGQARGGRVEEGLLLFTEDGRSRTYGPCSGTSPVYVEPGPISGWTIYVVRGGLYVEVIRVQDDLSILGDGDENYDPIIYPVPAPIRPATDGIRDVSHINSTTTIHYHNNERSRDIGPIRLNFWMERSGWVMGQAQEGIYGVLAYELATSKWFVAYSGDNQVPSVLAVGKDGPVVATSVEVMAFTDRSNFKSYVVSEPGPEPGPTPTPTPIPTPIPPPDRTDEVLQILNAIQADIQVINTRQMVLDTKLVTLAGEVNHLITRPRPNYRTSGRIFGAPIVVHSTPE